MCALSIGLALLCHLSIVTGITKGGYCEGFHKGGWGGFGEVDFDRLRVAGVT